MTTEQAILGTIPNPHHNAAVNIKITNGWVCKLQDEFFKGYQLTHQQYNILRILKGQHPKGVSIMDIKRRMIDKMSNVGRLVEKLQQKGFVERVENFNDRRVIFCSFDGNRIKFICLYSSRSFRYNGWLF